MNTVTLKSLEQKTRHACSRSREAFKGMTKGEWHRSGIIGDTYEHRIYAKKDHGIEKTIATFSGTEYADWNQIAAAEAVNGTFVKEINPGAVEDLKIALELFLESYEKSDGQNFHFHQLPFCAQNAREALQAAKL